MATAEVIRPALTFEMFLPGFRGGALTVRALKQLFGSDNYDQFRRAGKSEEYIPEMDRQKVDRQVYDQVGEIFAVVRDDREKFWQQAMRLANSTLDYARGILFADQERQATLTTNIAWSDGRPSSALERLTMPASLIGGQCRYEQGRQVVVGLLCAEVISSNENGHSKAILSEINDFLEEKLFIGKKGDPKNYHTFSYHAPKTNKLAGFSSRYPDRRFAEELWVKSLDFPVRKVGIRDPAGGIMEVAQGIREAGGIVEVAQVLYDQREKEIEATVVKALQRSLNDARSFPNEGLIETFSYRKDRLGFRLVVMEGERPLRDRVTADLEKLLRTFEGVYDIRSVDEVDQNNGQPNRVEFRRRQVYIEGLKNPIEVIIQTLRHYISYLYEVGNFNPELGMHDGPAHDLYKLEGVWDVSEYLWPVPVFGIDLAEAKKSASYEYATRLGRKQRIYPSPYID